MKGLSFKKTIGRLIYRLGQQKNKQRALSNTKANILDVSEEKQHKWRYM